MTLTPAFGRDYDSLEAVRLALAKRADFIVADNFSPYAGKPVNISQLLAAGEVRVQVRYAKLKRTAVIDITALGE